MRAWTQHVGEGKSPGNGFCRNIYGTDNAVSRYYANATKQLDFLCKDAEIQTFKTC